MLALLLLMLLLGPAVSMETAKDCEVYEAELRSRPDFAQRVVTSSLPLPPDFSITAVQQDMSRGRTFYWCRMEVRQGGAVRVYQHYGHNATHWWVTKGCGGWFRVTACRGARSNDTHTTDPHTTPTIVTVISNLNSQDGSQDSGETTEQPGSQQLKDINSGALSSLYHWLVEQRIPIQDKLGGSQNRAARSVDEEFAAEFGDN
ncbi:uncharacterized protein LOC143293344 [Babylonia areolata]|uniref:uncharacterized protein LOC143293344 n=1 Tax=Babylonia areolata TaxID=304850 RepID=UPI003FD62CB5